MLFIKNIKFLLILGCFFLIQKEHLLLNEEFLIIVSFLLVLFLLYEFLGSLIFSEISFRKKKIENKFLEYFYSIEESLKNLLVLEKEQLKFRFYFTNLVKYFKNFFQKIWLNQKGLLKKFFNDLIAFQLNFLIKKKVILVQQIFFFFKKSLNNQLRTKKDFLKLNLLTFFKIKPLILKTHFFKFLKKDDIQNKKKIKKQTKNLKKKKFKIKV